MNVILEKRNDISVDAQSIKAISGTLGVNQKLIELLFLRGMKTEKDVRDFLFPDVGNFHDPFLMKGMREAVDRIDSAIENNEKIVVYGDYDADGICSNAILSLYLKSRGVEVFSHTPNRIGDGYGLNNDTLEKIIEEVMPDLIITCDCGISCYDEVEFVKDLGVDIIVTDHHEPGEKTPDCVVINPKQNGCGYPFKGLCGAGVVLKLVQALSGFEVMEKYLDLCSVATIADLVPLLDENRLIVQLGLSRIPSTENIGLKALFSSNNLIKPMASDVAFKISPRINAAGRMGDAYRAFELLTTENRTRVAEIISELETENDRRKEMCNEMYMEALVDLHYEDIVNTRAIILCNSSWEKGITGILAAKLCGDFMRPTFVLAKSGDGSYKGTCRSIEGINIFEVLSACSDLLIEFGGHSQAAGFSISPDKVEAFKLRIKDVLSGYDAKLFLPTFLYDDEIELKDLNYDFVESLSMLEPTGNSNPKPTFKIKSEKTVVSPCKNNAAHVSINVDDTLQVFAFNYAELSYQLMSSKSKELVIELQRNSFGGKDIKGILRACSPEDLYVSDIVANAYNLSLSMYESDEKAEYKTYSCVDDVYTAELYGTLVVADNKNTYEKFIQTHEILVNEYAYVTTINNFSRIIVAPVFEQDNLSLANYNKIIFLFKPFTDGVISYLNSQTKATVYVPQNEDKLPALSTERNVFTTYYDMLKRNGNTEFKNFTAFYKKVKKEFPACDYAQLVLCTAVFEEVGIVSITREPFKIAVNKVKADLNNSKLYVRVKEENNRAGC